MRYSGLEIVGDEIYFDGQLVARCVDNALPSAAANFRSTLEQPAHAAIDYLINELDHAESPFQIAEAAKEAVRWCS